MSTIKSFETERLILRPCGEDDAAFIYELLNSESWLKYIGDRNVNSVEEAREHIKVKMLPQLKRLGFGNYCVIRKSDHAKMGTCGILDRDGLEGLDIGFAFLPKYEGKGYAFEAAERIKAAAFEDFNIPELTAITLPNNTSSRRLLEKLGLRFEKIINLPNDPIDLMFFRIKAPVTSK